MQAGNLLFCRPAPKRRWRARTTRAWVEQPIHNKRRALLAGGTRFAIGARQSFDSEVLRRDGLPFVFLTGQIAKQLGL